MQGDLNTVKAELETEREKTKNLQDLINQFPPPLESNTTSPTSNTSDKKGHTDTRTTASHNAGTMYIDSKYTKGKTKLR